MKRIKIHLKKNVVRLLLTIFVVTAMVGLLIIQVTWLKESIAMQETIFAKGVNLALQQTAQNMASDEALNAAMQNSIAKDSSINYKEVFTQDIIYRLDSTLQKELQFYHINLDFHFILINGEDTLALDRNAKVKNEELFHQSFTSSFPDTDLDLAIHFPGRSSFIMRRIGLMFAASVLLILFTIISIMFILYMYRKERSFAQQVKDMIGNLTHEFMTPISSISLAGNLILSRSQKLGDQAISQFATAIKEENRKLQVQVNRLIQLAAVENSGFEYNKTPIDIHQIIRDAVQEMAFQIKQSDAQVHSNYLAQHSVVMADSAYFKDVFVNLLANSIKYSHDHPVIHIETKNTEEKILISISDNGIGIPSREFKQIFEKYYRISTGDMHNVKGFGLGLFYVKTVVTAHDGTINVKSEPNKGSTFTIALPVVS
ncbi:MAG TPA: HAMP domain-containing sensor histidine kinase [Prolixibacteraceae bacterium]|nr:HAMP domain-containing sensor histidine kinase [Prolixibacteraceae bacterium]